MKWILEFENGSDAFALEQKLLKENQAYLIDTGLLKSGNKEIISVYVNKPQGECK